jgi:hypothetical protein
MKELYITLAIALTTIATFITPKALKSSYAATALAPNNFTPADQDDNQFNHDKDSLPNHRIAENNLFDLKRGAADEDAGTEVEAPPEDDHNFVLRGIIGVGDRSSVILNFSKPKSTTRKPTSRAPVRSSSQSSSTDKVFKLGNPIKYLQGETEINTGYTITEVQRSEVTLTHSSGKVITLEFDTENEFSQRQKELGYKTAITQQKQANQAIQKIANTATKPAVPKEPNKTKSPPKEAASDKKDKKAETKKPLTKEEKLKALKALQEKHKKNKKKK